MEHLPDTVYPRSFPIAAPLDHDTNKPLTFQVIFHHILDVEYESVSQDIFFNIILYRLL